MADKEGGNAVIKATALPAPVRTAAACLQDAKSPGQAHLIGAPAPGRYLESRKHSAKAAIRAAGASRRHARYVGSSMPSPSANGTASISGNCSG